MTVHVEFRLFGGGKVIRCPSTMAHSFPDHWTALTMTASNSQLDASAKAWWLSCGADAASAWRRHRCIAVRSCRKSLWVPSNDAWWALYSFADRVTTVRLAPDCSVDDIPPSQTDRKATDKHGERTEFGFGVNDSGGSAAYFTQAEIHIHETASQQQKQLPCPGGI